LRRRDLIARNEAAQKANIQPNQTNPYARLATYWGIDTDPTKLNPPGVLPCTKEIANQLAGLPTRLSDLGELQSKQLVNWGYGNGGKTQGDQDERTLARISSGKGGMAWLPGMFSRAPR
jgi:hypothetical protein